MRFTDKVAVITAFANGIGRATAEIMAREGAIVVGASDENGLTKPKAFVVAKPGIRADEDLERSLERHAKGLLAPFKCPRWYAFVDDLPKTATGKIQRFRLREPSP